MNWLKSKINVAVWGWSVLFGIILPLASDKLHFVRRAWMVGLVLFLINMLFSVWLGKYIKTHQLKWENLFVFPVIFLVISYFFMPKYTLYFALFYLGVMYLAWSISSQQQAK